MTTDEIRTLPTDEKVRIMAAIWEDMCHHYEEALIPMPPRFWIFKCSFVGQASRLTSNDLRLQARRPHYIPEVQKRSDIGIISQEAIDLLKERQARVDRGESQLLDWDKVKLAIGRG